jgi:hypothetical protein
VSNITPPHEVKIADKKRSLDELEWIAVAAHGRITCLEGDIARLDRERLPLAMRAGDALIEIVSRKLVKHGQRSALYIKTCGSVRTGQIYVSLSEHRALLESNAQRSACLSIAGALRLIRQAEGTARAAKPKPALDLAKLQDTALTVALLALGFDRLMKVLPPEFYPKLDLRKTAVAINRMRAKHPNLRLKRVKPRHLELVYDADEKPAAA